MSLRHILKNLKFKSSDSLRVTRMHVLVGPWGYHGILWCSTTCEYGRKGWTIGGRTVSVWFWKSFSAKNVHGEILIFIFNSQNHLKSKVAVNFIIWLLNRILMTKELVNDPLAVYKIVANETNNVDVALEVQKVFPSIKTRTKIIS